MKNWKIVRASIAGKCFLTSNAYCDGGKCTYESFDTLFCNEILIQTEYIVSVIFTSMNIKGYAQRVVFKLRIKYFSAHISSYFVMHMQAATYFFQMLWVLVY